ncbi:MAG: sodium:solute symporter family protein [Myxococcota bacterium]
MVVGWLLLTFGAGLWAGRSRTSDTDGFFLAGRSLPWWAVGTSMVATTFAADTPLAVSSYVASTGVHDNWKWWFTGFGAVATTFFFARLWRRSEVVTDAEIAELRYGGPAAKVLRVLKAVWFGLFFNLLVIAWVMRAMRTVVETVLGIAPDAMWSFGGLDVAPGVGVVLVLFLLAVGYTASSGLWGVVITDVLQFGLAMVGAILLAVLAWVRVGGLPGMQAGFVEHGFDWSRTTTLIPLDDPAWDGHTAKLVVLVGVTWWAARNVDGGSYLAQRLLAAKDEVHAIQGYLWFAVANIAIRPWPWVIVGLAGMALMGPIDDTQRYYPEMMVLLLPPGLLGVMVSSFLAAFMSTIDTQLHWGTSLLINDVYRPFVAPQASDAHHLAASRWCVIGLAVLGAVASFVVTDITFAWELALSVTAGLGTVFAARWYWWRVSAWSELAAMGVAMVGSFGLKVIGWYDLWPVGLPAGWSSFPFDAALLTFVSIPVWLAVTFLTPPCDREHLRAFYVKVRPGGPGWRAVAGDLEGFASDGIGAGELVGFVGATGVVFGALLGVGGFLVGRPAEGALWTAVFVAGLALTVWAMRRSIGGAPRPLPPTSA